MPDDGHLLRLRAQINALAFKKLEPAIADLEAALAARFVAWLVHELLATYCNNLAWRLAAKSASSLDLERALKLSFRAVELVPGRPTYLNTRGVVSLSGGAIRRGGVDPREESRKAGMADPTAWTCSSSPWPITAWGTEKMRVSASTARSNGSSHQSSLKGEQHQGADGIPRRGRGRSGRRATEVEAERGDESGSSPPRSIRS